MQNLQWIVGKVGRTWGGLVVQSSFQYVKAVVAHVEATGNGRGSRWRLLITVHKRRICLSTWTVVLIY